MKVFIGAFLFISISASYKVKIIDNIREHHEFIFHESLKSEANIRFKRDTQTDYENLICECVPYYQCNYNGSMNENGLGVIDIRTGLVDENDKAMTTRRKCDHYLSVCCLPPEIVPNNRSVIPTYNDNKNGDQDNNKNDDRISKIKIEQQGNDNGATTNKFVDKGCGYRNSKGVNFRIIGNQNNEANFAEFPWMVAIFKQATVQRKSTKVYQCGGSLIHKKVVLTAAHCITGNAISDLSVRAGEWDTQTNNEPLPHQDREVSLISIHPEYQPDILYNDFALLILSKPFELADNVQTTCLPELNESFSQTQCFATGWGKNKFGVKGRFQVLLKAVELSTVSHESCQNTLRSTRLGKYFKLHNSFICAGGVSDVDTCTGDGGSPLVCALKNNPTRYAQVGIVAWGIACGKANIPGVYADVTKARHWIDSTLTTYNIDSVSYSHLGGNKYN